MENIQFYRSDAEALDKLYLRPQGSSLHSTLTKVGIAITFAMALLGGSGAAITGIVMHAPYGVSFWVNLSVGGINLSVCLGLIFIQVIRAQEEVKRRQILTDLSQQAELPDNPPIVEEPEAQPQDNPQIGGVPEAELPDNPPIVEEPEAQPQDNPQIGGVPEVELKVDSLKEDVAKKRFRSKSLSSGLQIGKRRRRVYSLTQSRIESVDLSQPVEPFPQSFYPPRIPILPQQPSYPVNFGILQFVIADFVGGGKGNQQEAAVKFFRHYLHQYTQQFPAAKEPLRILRALNSFVQPSFSIPLSEASQQLIQKLQSEGYVAFDGGTYHSDGGHAIFCELILKNNQITLKVTNSGEGLEYHPRVVSSLSTAAYQRNVFYRTLVFSGATLEQLEACQFLPILLSFNRPRSSVVIDPRLPELSEYTDFKMHQIYALLFYNWPGKTEIVAENPGGAQRANSCSVQSVVKWMKGEFGQDTASYLSMTLWVKMLAFKDYLENEKNLSFAFIQDAVRRISTQASKMQPLGLLEDLAFDYLQELNRLAQIKGVTASLDETRQRHDSALSFPNGIDLSQAEAVSRKEEKSVCKDPQISSIEYQHRFVEDGPDYLQLPLLSQSYVAPLLDEMAYRLNFFRLLPTFDLFDFERDVDHEQSPQEYVAQQTYWAFMPPEADNWEIRASKTDPLFYTYMSVFNSSGKIKWFEIFKKELDQCMSNATPEQIAQFRKILFFNHLALTCQKFFYTSEEGTFSLHIHDPFFADLLNGWMIVYLEAQKIGDIDDEVLLEWMEGLHLLLSSHAAEYLFDTSAAQEKFSKVIQYVNMERVRLLEKLGPHYERPKNYWAIYDKKWSSGWIPFGAETEEEEGKIRQWSDLPAMARFAHKKQYKKVEPKNEYLQGVLAFGYPLLRVPYYSYLRESLALFFVLADRHLTCERIEDEDRGKTISVYPHESSSYTRSLSLFTWFSIQTKRPGVNASPRYFPEHHIPKESNSYASLKDLNQRIQGCLNKSKGPWPFFTEQEESEFLAFVQKDPLTRLGECLTFFEKRLEKLANPDYQLAFEHILFGEKGEVFERLFRREESVDLLFSFLNKSFEALLKKGPKTQSAASFLFQIHLRLCHIASNRSDFLPRLEQLFTIWNTLFESAKKNPRLGKSLGEAVFSSMGLIESSATLRDDPRTLPLLARTLLLECMSQVSLPPAHHPLTLHYGYRAFIELLSRNPLALDIWKEAAHAVGKPLIHFEWERGKGTLKADGLTFYLVSRNIDGGEESTAHLIPKNISVDTNYKKVFGNKRVLAHGVREADQEVYLVKWRSADYKLVVDKMNGSKLHIYKKFEDSYYIYTEPKDLLHMRGEHAFVRQDWLNPKTLFWEDNHRIFVEDKASGKLIAMGDHLGVHPIKKGRLKPHILGQVLEGDVQNLLERLEDQQEIYIWLDPQTEHIAAIEITRLGLKFVVLKKDQERGGELSLGCSKYPGFFVAVDQHISFFKNFHHYVVLENAKGQKKVIVPIRPFTSKLDYQPYQDLKLSCKLQDAPLGCMVIDLEPGQRDPSLLMDTPALMMLLHIYLETGQYHKALELITQTSLTAKRKLSSDQMGFLEKMLSAPGEKSAVNHPHAVALRMHLYSWKVLIQKTESNPLSSTGFKEDFDKYRDIYHSLGRFKISDRSFENLLKHYDTGFMWEKRVENTFTFETFSQKGPLTWLWQARDLMASRVECLPITSFAKPGQEFILNFLPFYKIAKEGGHKEKQDLMRLLAACKDKSSSISFLCQLLVFALTKQEPPSFEEIHRLFSNLMEENDFYSQCNNLHDRALKEAILNKKHNMGQWCQGSSRWMNSEAKTIQKNPLAPPDLDPLKPYPFPSRLTFKAQMHCELPDLDGSIRIDPIEGPQNIPEAANQVLSWATAGAQKAEADQNPLVQAEFERLKEGALELLQEYQEGTQNGLPPKVPALSADAVAIQKVVHAYTTEIQDLKKQLSSLKETILKAANETHRNQKCTLEFMRDLRTPFDMETLLIALGREDFVSIQASNPTLTQAGIERLMQKVADYAILLSHINQLKRCRLSLAQYKTLLLANPDDPALSLKATEYFAHRHEKRVFKPYENPRLLVFEALGDLLIRTEQYEATLSLADVNEVWKLIEARTGFGKSKVLLPLWLILSAQPDTLAMMVSPANIFDGQENFLQKKMYTAYRFFCVRLHFSRESECTPEEIHYLLATLQEAQRLRRPVFMSDQTAHNLLVLKVKEMAQIAVKSGQHETLSALLELRRYIKKQAVLFVDEPHKVLDDSQESNYSLGSPEGFDKHRLLFSWHLYSALFGVLEGRYRIECWQPPQKGNLPLLTEITYRKEILEQLLNALIRQGHVDVNDDKTRSYLLGVMEMEDQLAFEKALQGKAGAKIRILHDQLHHYLPQTMQQHVNEHYGCLDAEVNRLAVPFEDALNPIKDNEFSAADQIINFTIQANLGTPFSHNYIVQFLRELTEQASQEMEKGAETLHHTRAYAKFLSIVETMGSQAPSNLLKIQSIEIERIGAHLEKNIQAKLRFITLSVLPQLRRYSQKIISTPHLLFPCFKKVVGASGTLAMNNLPHQLHVQTDKKAIVKTLVSLCRKYQEAGSPAVMEFPIQNSRQIFFHLRQKMVASGLAVPNVLIEIGAIMRLFPSFPAVIQDLLAVFPEFEGVASFDEQGAIVVIKKGSKRPVPYSLAGVKDEKLFWLYPQKDITGTDVKLPPLSQAVIPINRHNTLTELIQGSGRLREIHTGQAGWFGVDIDTAAAIKKILGKKEKDSLSLFDLLTYCVLKETDLKGPANVRSLQLQWDALLENAFWDFALKATVDEVVKAFSILQNSLLIQTTPDAPLERPMMCLKPVDIHLALGILRSAFNLKLELIETTLKSSTQELKSKFTPQAFAEDVKKIQAAMPYPNQVLLNDDSQATQVVQAASNVNVGASADLSLNVEAQGHGEQVAENQTESNQLWTSWVMNAVSSKRPLPHLSGITSHPVQEVLSHPKLVPYQPLFNAHMPLRLTENSYRTFQGDTLQHPGWVNGYMKPLHYLWIEHTGDIVSRCILCDMEDAAYLMQDSRPGTLWLVNQGVYLSRQGKSSADLLQDKTFRAYELQAKLLNGDVSLNPQQLADFNEVYGEKKELVRSFVETILVPLHPLLTSSPTYNCLLE